MLIKDLYHILSTRRDEDCTVVSVALNPRCEVFRGHFPSQPVLPGVCAIQMILECSSMPGSIVSVERCRFTHLLSPDATPQVEIHYLPAPPDRISAEIWAADIKCVTCQMTIH